MRNVLDEPTIGRALLPVERFFLRFDPVNSGEFGGANGPGRPEQWGCGCFLVQETASQGVWVGWINGPD